MSDVDVVVMVILMTIAGLASFWLAARVQELIGEKNLLLRQNARLREALRTVRYGCETAEEQAAARYGMDWRNEVIDKALEGK